MVSLARRHLNGYYGKLKNERRMLRKLEGSGHWTLAWSVLFVYGLFIILFGCAMFAMVFVQVSNNINQFQAESDDEEAKPLCGLHHSY